MDEKRMLQDAETYIGVDFHHTDGQKLPPTSKRLHGGDAGEWFQSHPDFADEVNFKVLAKKIDCSLITAENGFRPPIDRQLIEHTIWNPSVYEDLVGNPSGGAAALLDEPYRFILQTPLDGGPFCSLAMSKIGTVVKGVYFYDCDNFEPTLIGTNEYSMSGWRSTGFQIINMPQAILRAHSTYVSQSLGHVIDEVKHVEEALLSPETCDIAALSRTLHTCSRRTIDLERRSRFDQTLITAIETVVSSSRTGRMPWPSIASQKSTLQTRVYDFESLPRRIDNARNAMAVIIQQHNERMNLEIADATRRMTEIALSDNASMKTIAILTMIFLPGTAVASFFSMAMFDWSSSKSVTANWLWVYFVVAVPLTLLVVMIWWVWGSQAMLRRRHRHRFWSYAPGNAAEIDDVELADG